MKKVINFRPILYFAVSLCMGILASYSFLYNKIALGIVSITAFVICTLLLWLFWKGNNDSLLEKNNNPVKFKIVFTIVALLLAIVGGLNMCLTVNIYDDSDIGGKNYRITARIIETKPMENGNAFLLDDISFKGSMSGRTSYKIMLYSLGENDFDIGDVIEFKAYLTDKNSLYEGKFSAYNVADGIKHTSSVKSENIKRLYTDRTIFENINVFIRDTLKVGLDKNEFSVAYALLCGNSEYMADDVISNFRAAGVAHIFAVSGLHIGFLAVVLNFIANKLKFNKYLKFIVVVGVLILYSGICGFTPSSIRATVMAGVLLMAEILGKKYDGLTSISMASIVILVIAPVQLFCVGFQLSFGVVLGISVLSRPISNVFKFLPKKISSSIGVVLSAQIFGIPISLAAFGEISLIAIVANLIFIPFVGIIYVLLLVSTLIGGLFGIPIISLFLSNYIFKFIIMLITAFDYKIFMVGGFSFFIFSGFYYLSFIIWSDKINLKVLLRSIVCAISVVAFTLGVTLYNISERNAVKLVAIGGNDASIAVVASKDDTVVIVSSAKKSFSLNSFDRAYNAVGSDDIDAIIVTNTVEDVSVQITVSIFARAYNVKSIYYYDKNDPQVQTNLEKNFTDKKIKAIKDEDNYEFENFSVSIGLNGFCSIIKTTESIAYLFAEFGAHSAKYAGLPKNPNVIFAVDYSDILSAEYSPKNIVCYRKSVQRSALTEGNIMFKI